MPLFVMNENRTIRIVAQLENVVKENLLTFDSLHQTLTAVVIGYAGVLRNPLFQTTCKGVKEE
ncbi:hypothetical protein BALCAV_0211470 [Alkalihalobacillus alcalophilus ATCC 27647 = CGMCC 1.3604]|uniref:Uncharacterized protein n=1 Tax=Alkalihalobacillus alcalophilus ATCC 27647 = CGMCC 1.3604 TaxID=1218173 RepID=A0A094XEN3_ALKAL|nr:hypothetical protein BALCAV_0211470 [Alkalihalobacillus alcalophilus ATCC 27647 = CGMCC 1.3604]